MVRRGRRANDSMDDDSSCPWDMPKPPARPHQVPYSPLVTKKGVDIYILRMNRDVSRAVLQRGLFRLLRDHILIYELTVEVDMFGSVNGHLVVPSRSDAREMVKKFHRTGFYGRVLEFSELDPNLPIPVAFKKAVMKVFEDKKKSRLLLAELMRLFEEEYDQCLTVLDVLKMPDILERYTDGGTQMIRLLPSARSFRANLANMVTHFIPRYESARCRLECCSTSHFSHGTRYGSSKSMSCYRISLREFVPQVQKLLRLHQGSMSLSSFVGCYEAHFGPLEEDETDGVFLEHLLSCVSGVEFQMLPYQSRKVVMRQWDKTDSRSDTEFPREYRGFHREIYDMLVIQRGCALSFSEFVQSYRMNYDKICRVADYGCTRLIDLLQLFHGTMHVIGTGMHRVLTLTFEEQKRRFGRVLDQIHRQGAVGVIRASNFESLYRVAFKSQFVPADFGVCFVEDLLDTQDDYGSIPSNLLARRRASPQLVSSDFGSFGPKSDAHVTDASLDVINSETDKSSLPEAKLEDPLSSPVSWHSLSESSSQSGNSTGKSAGPVDSDAEAVVSPVPVQTLGSGVISSRLAMRFY